MGLINSSIAPLPPLLEVQHPDLYRKLRSAPLTVDCFLRLAIDPNAPGIEQHPALCEGLDPPSVTTFQVYLRLFNTTVKQAREDLTEFRVS